MDLDSGQLAWGRVIGTWPPNKRLKLAGGIALKEAECCAPGGARTVVRYSCADGWVARSLSAIR